MKPQSPLKPEDSGLLSFGYRHQSDEHSLRALVTVAYYGCQLDKDKSIIEREGSKFVFKDGSCFSLNGRNFIALNGDNSEDRGVFFSPIILPSDASFEDLKNSYLVKCVGMNPEAYSSKILNGLRLILSRMDSKYVDDPVENLKTLVGPISLDDYIPFENVSKDKDSRKYSVENLAHALLRVYGYDSHFEPVPEEEEIFQMGIKEIQETIESFNQKDKLSDEEQNIYNQAVNMLEKQVKCEVIESKALGFLLTQGIISERETKMFEEAVQKYTDLHKIRGAYVSQNGLKGKEKGKALFEAHNDIFLIAEVVYDELKRKFAGVHEDEVKEHFIKTLEEYGFSSIDLVRVKSKFDQGAYRLKKEAEDEVYGGTLNALIGEFYKDLKVMNEYLHWHSKLIFGDPSLELGRLAQITRFPVLNVEGEHLFKDGEPQYRYAFNGEEVDFNKPGEFYSGKEYVVKALFNIREGGYFGLSLKEFLQKFYKDAGLDPGAHRVYAVELEDDAITLLASQMGEVYTRDGREAGKQDASLFMKEEITSTIEKRVLIEALFNKSGKFGKCALEYLVKLASDGMVDPFEELGIEEFFRIIKRYPDNMDDLVANFLIHSFREYVRPEKVYSENIGAATNVFSKIITYGLDDMPYLLPQFLKIYAKGMSKEVRFGKSRSTEHKFLDIKFVHGELDRWEEPLEGYKGAQEMLWLIERAFDSIEPDTNPAYFALEYDILASIPQDSHETHHARRPPMIPEKMVKTLVKKHVFTEALLKNEGILDENGNIKSNRHGYVEFKQGMRDVLEKKQGEEHDKINPFHEAIFDYRRVSMGGCVSSCSKLTSAMEDVETLFNLVDPVSGFLDEEGFDRYYGAKQRVDSIDRSLEHEKPDYVSEFVFDMIKEQILLEKNRKSQGKKESEIDNSSKEANYEGSLKIVDIVREEMNKAEDKTSSEIYQVINQRIEGDPDAKEASEAAKFDVDELFEKAEKNGDSF